VTPRRNAQPGPHQGRIKVTGKASQGQRVVSECRFGFISLPDLHPVPSIIVGEPRPVGSTLSETVVISSRSRKSIEIIGFDPDSDAIRVASANRTEGGLPMLNVTVAVCELGQKAYQLKVHLRCKTSKLESTVTIPVHVYGVRQPAE